MIALLDTSEELEVARKELGYAEVGQLITPLTGRKLEDGYVFGIDNGAYSRFREKRFLAILRRELPHQHLCKFVAIPDVVGSARRTMELYDRWRDRECLRGWPLALVMQDGMEDIAVPWEDISAIFIGGSTQWKLSSHAEACIRAAKMLGKWVHVGRVNTPQREDKFLALEVDSFDGTGVAMYSKMRSQMSHPKLFGGANASTLDPSGEMVLLS